VPRARSSFATKGTLLDQVQLVHQAIPEHHYDEIDLSTPLLGKVLKAPLVISAMTGGTDEAQAINRDLARAAETLGLGFGLGSQRAMLVRPETTRTFLVREHAPTALVLGNLGLVQAQRMSTDEVRMLCQTVGADALCIHLATAMELVQPGGDRDFRGGLETLRRLHHELGIPIVVKETGCGLSRQVGLMVRRVGITAVDVSGAGGTSWVGVETHRAAGVAQGGGRGAVGLGGADGGFGVAAVGPGATDHCDGRAAHGPGCGGGAGAGRTGGRAGGAGAAGMESRWLRRGGRVSARRHRDDSGGDAADRL
jgi:isopentenyl-diphosphate delta-isomerase